MYNFTNLWILFLETTKKRLTKLEWQVISFALSTLEANAGDDLDCYGKDAEKMKNALFSAKKSIIGRSPLFTNANAD